MPHRWKAVPVALVVILALLAACGEADEPTSPAGGAGGSAPTATTAPEPTPTTVAEATNLDGTSWVLSGMDGTDLDLQFPITLSFTDGQAGGNAGCNDYGATYAATGDGTITFEEIHNTDMDCESGMDIESRYLDALGRVGGYALSAGRLDLLDLAGEQMLVFTSDERSELDGTRWIVATFDDALLVTDTHIRFEFSHGGVFGSAGCNDFFADVRTDESGGLSFSNVGHSTEGCMEPEGIMEQEEAFLDALIDVTSYRELGTTHIELLNADGEARLVLSNRDQSPPAASLLANTAWVLKSQHGEPVDDVTITLMFGRDGFSGMADCVSYSSTVDVSTHGELAELSDIRTIDQCDHAAPPDSADIYLDVLAQATGYRFIGDQLEFRSDSGETLLAYRPAITDSDLQGPHWSLLTLNGNPVIEGSEITLGFAEWAGGYSGCNSHGAEYMIIVPGVIWIREVATDQAGCPEPPFGLGQQERDYYEALSNIVAYRVTGDRLELMNAAGEVTLLYEKR